MSGSLERGRPNAPSERTIEVAPEEAGERLDKLLVSRFPGLGRRGARQLVEGGLVRVGGVRAAKSRRVEAGDVISVQGEWDAAPPAEPDAPLVVRLERSDLVVVEKPAGQATAPLVPTEAGSLASALLGRYPEMAGIGYRAREPGILHRLDTRTSGLVIAARTPLAFSALREALEAHRLDKRYLAVVEAASGLPDSGSIERVLMQHPSGVGRVVVAPPDVVQSGARACRSAFRTVARSGRFALVEVSASRAYRHQVRVLLAASGWPILGDLEYGGDVSGAIAERHALHASHVAWSGDERVPAFAVDSPLPDDLAAFVRPASDSELSGRITSSSS